MKKRYFFIAVLLVIGIMVSWYVHRTSQRMIANISLNEIVLSECQDGVFVGSAESEIVKAKVQVSVSSGTITEIEILEHDTGIGKPAEAIVDDVIERQSLNTDVVSGATVSSKVILKAVENALISSMN